MSKPKAKANSIIRECLKHTDNWDYKNDCRSNPDPVKSLALFIARTAQKGAKDEQYWDNVISYINAI